MSNICSKCGEPGEEYKGVVVTGDRDCCGVHYRDRKKGEPCKQIGHKNYKCTRHDVDKKRNIGGLVWIDREEV